MSNPARRAPRVPRQVHQQREQQLQHFAAPPQMVPVQQYYFQQSQPQPQAYYPAELGESPLPPDPNLDHSYWASESPIAFSPTPRHQPLSGYYPHQQQYVQDGGYFRVNPNNVRSSMPAMIQQQQETIDDPYGTHGYRDVVPDPASENARAQTFDRFNTHDSA